MNLVNADLASTVKVVGIDAEGELRRRFFDLWIIEGTEIDVMYRGPFGDPTAHLIRGTLIALRGEDSEKIQVVSYK